MNKRVLVIALSFALSISSVSAFNFFSIFNAVGSCTDYFVTKGKLSAENEQLFNEVANDLGIAHRNIQARNSGLFMRIVFGYNNALAYVPTNRVYFNESCLNEMSKEERKFIMAHELAHHAKNHPSKHGVVRLAVLFASNYAVSKAVERRVITLDKTSDNYLYRYFTYGLPLNLSIWGLVDAQCGKYFEKEADAVAIVTAHVDSEDGARCLTSIYKPNTEKWPLYAKVGNWINQKMLFMYNLPILKWHKGHLTSCDDRIADLRALKA